MGFSYCGAWALECMVFSSSYGTWLSNCVSRALEYRLCSCAWAQLPHGHVESSWIKPLSPALTGEFFTTQPPGKLQSPLLSSYCIFLWLLLCCSYKTCCDYTGSIQINLPISRFLTTYAKSLLPQKVAFIGSGDENVDVLRGHYLAYHTI